MATVELMAASGLPCFGRGRPVDNLRARFRLDLADAQVLISTSRVVEACYLLPVCLAINCDRCAERYRSEIQRRKLG